MSYGAEEKEAMRQRDADESGEPTDETEDTDMTEESTQTEASGIEAEIETIRGDGALENLECRHTGGLAWVVLSARNGSVDAHKVHIGNRTCTCEHGGYNGDNEEACAHIIYVMLHGEQEHTVEGTIVREIGQQINEMYRLTDEVSDLHEAMDETRVEQLSNGAATPDTQSDDTPEPPTPEEAYEGTERGEEIKNAPDAEEKAEELQAAFDDVIDDMEVEVYEGNIWFKTGYNTPDNLPIMGKPDTWETLIKNPDVQTFEPEGGPGEYFKNYLAPDEVETYISEVLE